MAHLPGGFWGGAFPWGFLGWHIPPGRLWGGSLSSVPRPRSTPSCVFLPGRFSSVFPSLNMAVKRREQALQDYKRLQSKVEKYEEKERTGPVLAKLHQVRPRSLGATPATSFVATREPRWVQVDLFQSHAELSGFKMKGNKKIHGKRKTLG